MKKITAIVLSLCLLLLTAGCAGISSDAVSGKEELDVREISKGSSSFAYAVESLDFPQNVWFNLGNNIVSIENKLYLLGGFLEGNYLFRMNSDGTEAKLLASCEDGSERWYACCAMGGKLYVMDTISSQLIEFDPDGTRLRCIALPEKVAAIYITGGADTIFVLDGATMSALKIGEENKAELAYTIKAPAALSIAQNTNGTVFVAWKDGETQAISTIDEENRAWGETHHLSSTCSIIGVGTEWELYLCIGAAMYGYNFSTESIQKLLTFSDSGLSSSGVVYEAGDGKLIYTGQNGLEPSPPLLLKPVEITDENMRLTMATLVPLDSWGIKDAVLSWNQAHPECPIEIKDYSAYTTDENPNGAQQQLMLDIAAGNIPDLYNMTDYYGEILNASLLARRGLLEDLYPYIDSDQELSRDDFFSNALSALEINGGLYQMVPGLTLVTTMAAARDVGTSENWTYEQLERIVAESDYYQYLFSDFGYSRDSWLELMAMSSGKKLVDWSAGQCYFDSGYFIHLLELAAAWPERTDTGGGNVAAIVQNSHALLFIDSAQNVRSAGVAPYVYGEGNYAFVGLPEIGGVLIPEISLGMSAQSSRKEQCWQFLREFLLHDSPYTFGGIPLRRDGARQQLLDELERSKDDPIEHPGREQAMEEMITIMENANALYQKDIQLWNMIKEEVNKFYAGRRTAEETAKAIQSRASIYLSEQQ